MFLRRLQLLAVAPGLSHFLMALKTFGGTWKETYLGVVSGVGSLLNSAGHACLSILSVLVFAVFFNVLAAPAGVLCVRRGV